MSGSERNAAEKTAPKRHYHTAHVLRATAAKLLLMAFRVRALDISRVPTGTGAIIAGNHVSYADPVLLWCRAPRLVHFMGKRELWENPVFAWALNRVAAFPVKRGSADREAITAATEFLKAGELVGIFPEGTRARDTDGLGDAHQGVAFIAMHAGVPIVPVGIDGTARIKPKGSRMLRFPRVTMCFGEPVDPADYADLPRKERLGVVTREVMERIAAEVERAERA